MEMDWLPQSRAIPLPPPCSPNFLITLYNVPSNEVRSQEAGSASEDNPNVYLRANPHRFIHYCDRIKMLGREKGGVFSRKPRWSREATIDVICFSSDKDSV